MSRMVRCVKLGQELPGLDFAPLKGELGARIYRDISAEAWKQWMARSTMVINEYRLNPSEPQGEQVLLREMESFLFGGGGEAPPDFVAPPG